MLNALFFCAAVVLAQEPNKEDVLTKACRVSGEAEKIRSAVAKGTFERYVQHKHDHEPQLRTKAAVLMYFGRGKYHLQLKYETKLHPLMFFDQDGKKGQAELEECKPDEYIAINDGISLYSISFAARYAPTGCYIEASDVPEYGPPHWGLPWRSPARLTHEVLNLRVLIENLGLSALAVSAIPNEGARIGGQVKNAPNVRFEYDLLPRFGFNVIGYRLYNKSDERPVVEKRLTWKKAKGLWYVARITEDSRILPGTPREVMTRSTLQFDEFEPNVEVNPKLFTLDCVDIPPNTRIFERR